jgi:hypothetical protein
MRRKQRTGPSDSMPEIAAFGGNNTSGPIEVATAVNAKGGGGSYGF